MEISNKITVKKILSTKNIVVKKSKTVNFKAKLMKKLSGKKITFKIKNKVYKVKTNNKGIATLKLKNLKQGKYVIYTSYLSSKIRNTIKIKG